MLWNLRYRDRQRMVEVVVEASSEERAIRVGEAYVGSLRGKRPGESYRYVGVRRLTVADESILAARRPQTAGEKKSGAGQVRQSAVPAA
jgi:hypothetical protein